MSKLTGTNALVMKELARRELAKRTLLANIQYFRPDYIAEAVHVELCELMDAFIEAVMRQGSPRLCISLPPRVGKSTVISEHLAPYILGLQQKLEIVACTYNQTLADHFGRKVRDRLQDPAYLDLFDVKLDPRSQSADYVKLLAGGSYTAVGMGGALTGRGAHVLIIDDPVKDRAEAESQIESDNAWDWYSSTARTRLHPGGGIVVLQTRWAPNDLTGRLIDNAAKDPNADQWRVFNFSALAEVDEPHRKKGESINPKRYSREDYLRIKATVLPRDWAALYCGKPYLETGNFFASDTVHYYTKLPDELAWCLGVDYATSASKKSDKCAMVPLGITHDGHIYISEEFFYDQCEPWDAVLYTITKAKALRCRDLGGESGPIQNTLGSIFDRIQAAEDWYVTISKHVRRSSKAVAANTMKALMFGGKLHFPDTPRIRQEIIPELMRFDPRVDRGGDDFLDAVVNGLMHIEAIGRPAVPIPAAAPSWREPGKVYMDDLKWGKKKKSSAIPKLRGDW